ncbi:MAG: hypothetical protein AB8I52_12820 [Candidatus Promineifilaceae bacterium]
MREGQTRSKKEFKTAQSGGFFVKNDGYRFFSKQFRRIPANKCFYDCYAAYAILPTGMVAQYEELPQPNLVHEFRAEEIKKSLLPFLFLVLILV